MRLTNECITFHTTTVDRSTEIKHLIFKKSASKTNFVSLEIENSNHLLGKHLQRYNWSIK